MWEHSSGSLRRGGGGINTVHICHIPHLIPMQRGPQTMAKGVHHNVIVVVVLSTATAIFYINPQKSLLSSSGENDTNTTLVILVSQL